MAFDIEDWDDDENIAEPIRLSAFAGLLREIGPYNANLIENLELGSADTWKAADNIILATELCSHHVFSLKTLEVLVDEKEVSLDKSPEYLHPDYSSPFWANGPFSLMYRSLKKFVHRVHWLENFYYDTTNVYAQWKFEEPYALEDLRELEHVVKERTRARKMKADRCWRARQDTVKNRIIEVERDEAFVEFWHSAKCKAV
ncbi:MAG: hypothetical protein LQ352_005689 [Teloschistes flavicans]|nr:MAG: hypothetical protein LQ352_005689 [Teloschistes flavicans]